MTDAITRPRRDDDIPQLARVRVEVHNLDGYPVEGVMNPEAWLHLNEPIGAWVAELGGKPVGHVGLTEPGQDDEAPRLLREELGTPMECIAVLGRLFVAPSARGRQLGARLTKPAVRAAAGCGRRAVLDVMCKDRAAISTYESLGWRSLGGLTHRSSGQEEPAIAFAAAEHIHE